MTNFRPPDEPVRIGVDGGATKTALIMTDRQGHVIFDRTGPGCSPSHLGSDGARALIQRLLHDLISGIPGIQHRIELTRLYMAGSPGFWGNFASNLKGFGNVVAADDSGPLLHLTCGSDPGLVIHCGTGSFVAARDHDGTDHYAGGLGWRLSDPGSALDIGRRATIRALMEFDGWRSRSGVADLLDRESNCSTRKELLDFLYLSTDPNPFLAGLAPAVAKLADAGSDEAETILIESLQPLVTTASQVACRLNLPSECRLGLSGNLFLSRTAGEAAISELQSANPAWHVIRITEPPIEGVRRILAAD
jgi:glucosamine kinase